MDVPGMNILEGNCLNVGNNESQEEAEDLEEQIRRREELQNLLINALDDFKYEDSTINSSTNISVISVDCIDQTYGDSQTPYEQLKLLYDIRMKEVQSLKDEFDCFKTNSSKEIDTLKRKLTLQEAETSQMEISWKNTKSLLVEKMDLINNQDRELASKDGEIEKLRKIVEELQYDIHAYSLTIEELQLKLAMDTGPFNVAARKFNSEELQNNHKEQIEKLEALLEEQKKKIEIMNKENMQLQDDLKTKVDNDNENGRFYNNTIALLNANVESAQKQCKDLLNLVEMLSKENDHYRGRIEKLEAGEPILLSNSFKRKSLDYNTLLTHNERLKKMLLDKDVEVSTLKSKAKFYEFDMKELIEYRTIKNESLFNKECSKSEHAENIAFMQYELKNLQHDIIEKEKQISELSLINKELENKIETMIIQTRNELEVISNKYKLPELETMKEELQNTEMKIKELQQKLAESEAEADELRSKLKDTDNNQLKLLLNEEEKKILVLEEKLRNEKKITENYTSITQENKKLKRELERAISTMKDIHHYQKIEEELVLLKQEYSTITEQLKELNKSEEEEHSIDNMLKLRADIASFWNINSAKIIQKELMEIKIASWINQIDLNCARIRNISTSNCKGFCTNLQQAQMEIEALREEIRKLKESKILMEDEMTVLKTDSNNVKEELIKKDKELNDLEGGIMKNEDQMKTLEEVSLHLEEAKQELINCQEELCHKCEIIKKNDLETIKLEAEVENAKENLELSQKEMQKLQKVIDELLCKEKRKSKEDGDSLDNEYHDKAKFLTVEVNIRENLRKDYQRKISKIEENYKNILEINQQKLNKYKEQENNYRHQLADVLSKYAQMIAPIQKENEELKEHLNKIQVYYNELKTHLESKEREYQILIQSTKGEAQKSIDEWKLWAKSFVQGSLSIEKLNAQSRNKILNSLQESESQIESIDKYFEEKMRQYRKKIKIPKTKI